MLDRSVSKHLFSSVTLDELVIMESQIEHAVISSFNMAVDPSSHNANTPMQYTAIFHGCKNVNFQIKTYIFLLIFAQNIDCGYTLEPPQRARRF